MKHQLGTILGLMMLVVLLTACGGDTSEVTLSLDQAVSATNTAMAFNTQVAMSVAGTQTISAPTPTSTLSPEQLALTPVARNEDWRPVERAIDGVMMVLVPAGCFMMGSNTGSSDERPVHEQCFDAPFWIDKHEVSQAQFEQLNGEKANPNRFTGGYLPVESITWFEAQAYCEARGGRLPTEREWEYVARGPSNWVYPWGNDFVANNVVYSDNSNSQTAPVGSRPDGASWVGALDMAGNVWEWTLSIYNEYPYNPENESINDIASDYVLRGGSWDDILVYVRSVDRYGFNPMNRYSFLGVRCVRSQS